MNVLLTYDLGRIPMTLGHLGLIALICRTPWLEQCFSRVRCRRTDGFDELSDAKPDVPADLHRRRPRLVRPARQT